METQPSFTLGFTKLWHVSAPGPHPLLTSLCPQTDTAALFGGEKHGRLNNT